MAYCDNFLLSLFVLTTTLMFFFISPSNSILEGKNNGDVVHAPKVSCPPPVKPRKVDLVLYYESLCPACADFITNDLVKVFQTDLNTIVNFRLVPWGGNAKVINGTIVCEHGEDECYLNSIHTCAIKAWPEVKTHFSFISCIEAEISAMQVKQHSQYVETAWRKCADDLGLPQEPIDNCYNSRGGTNLTLGYGEETYSLKYVPWVTVNYVPLKENYKDYIQYVCKAYKGKPIEACKSNLSSSLTLKETFPWSINPKITVHIKNGFSISKEKPLVIHCWSEHDDLGEHTIWADNEFQFSFRDSIISRTHFWCEMHHDTHTKNSIDVYDDKNERIKCPSTSNCYWLVHQYAFFFSQDQEYWSIVSYW